MNRFNSRVNKLTAKMHDYFSFADLEIMRDYYNALLTDNGTSPEQYKIQCAQIDDIYESMLLESSQEAFQKINDMCDIDPNIACAYVHKMWMRECQQYPKGKWISKSYSNSHLDTLQDAKKYFRDRKT